MANLTIATPDGRTLSVTAMTVTDGLSDPITIPGTALNVRCRVTPYPYPSWRVDRKTRPPADLGQLVAAIETAGEPVLAQLFGSGLVEPYKSWLAIWHSQLPLPYRLGVVLLAMAQRTQDIRMREVTHAG